MNYLRNSANFVWSQSYVLGKGATGTVYQGVDKKTGEPVAVKSFNRMTQQLLPVDVHMREFEVVKVLDHENIVKMIAVEEEVQTQKQVIIMELCNGGSLYTILDDPQNSYGLEEEEFLCVLKGLSAGMKYLRDKNISHRDLKPGNIMKFIDEEGRCIIKLTDFGAARVLCDDDQFVSLYGTEEYLHPDMYERAVLHQPAKKSFKATVDLWSIGVTLYHVATGSLPFRAYGGRQNRSTMHYITTKKDSGVISGVQHTENGPIEWSRELPKTCLLNQGLQELVTTLLAGLLECDEKLMWTFDQFFNYVTDIFNRKVFHVFYMNKGKEICLYVQPNQTLDDLKHQIYSQTKVSSANQLLLFDKSLFISQINPTADVSTFPSTTLEQPLILVHMENTNVKDLTILGSVSACFPNFPSSPVSTDNDAALAKTCCSVAHAVKRFVVKIVRCNELLLRIPTILLSVLVENVMKLCSSSDVLNLKTSHVTQTVETLGKMSSYFAQFITLWAAQDIFVDDLQRFKDIANEQNMLFDQVKQKVFNLLSSISVLNERVCISKRLQKEWEEALSACMKLNGCVERADTYVGKMRDSWQVLLRDRSMRAMPPQSNQFHMLERVKIQQTCKKLLSLLQDQCLKACLLAFNKLDELYSGIHVTMVQCKCLEDELKSASADVKDFNVSLIKAEKEIYKLGEKLVYIKSASLQINGSDPFDPNNVSLNTELNDNQGETSLHSKKYFKKISSYIQALKSDHVTIKKVLNENNVMIKELSSLFDVEDGHSSDSGEK